MAKYKVAVATNDGVNVNVHFGHAAAFDIYEVDDGIHGERLRRYSRARECG